MAKNGVKDHEKAIKVLKYQEKNGKDIRSKETMALAKANDLVKSESDLKYFGERLKANGISQAKIDETKGSIRYMNGW